jgi:hypothetical protein
VERAVAAYFCRPDYDAVGYDKFVLDPSGDSCEHIVDASLQNLGRPLPALLDLIRVASDRKQSWMAWKARIADAVPPGAAFLPPVDASRAARVAGRVVAKRWRWHGRSDPGRDLEAGLLRFAAGLRIREVATEIGLSVSSTQQAIERHRRRLGEDPGYEEIVLRVLRSAVRRRFGDPERFVIPLRIDFGGES